VKLLLDTHVFLWFISGYGKLSQGHREAMRSAAPSGAESIFMQATGGLHRPANLRKASGLKNRDLICGNTKMPQATGIVPPAKMMQPTFGVDGDGWPTQGRHSCVVPTHGLYDAIALR